MAQLFKALAAGLVALVATTSLQAAASEKVDVALVLASDISYSVGPNEMDLQRRGYVDAFRSPDVIQAMVGGRYGRVAITYFEWAGPDTQAQILPWVIIADPADALEFARLLEEAELHRSGQTSISEALFAAKAMFATAPPALRHVIDISSDGYNNSGRRITEARDDLVWHGITINGLPILTDEAPDLDVYFRDCVIGGPGAIMHVADGPEDFAEALRKKMILELSGYPSSPERLYNAAAPDCIVGERLAREKYLKQLDDFTHGRSKRWQPREEDWPTPK